jgi:phosphoglycolate phosphatase-like HAD superfamily hydrolase
MSKKAITLSRPWDAFDAYLFDIDGTLLHCEDLVHYSAFCEVLGSIAGKPLTLEGVVAHGNTDIGILRDVLALAGVSENRWRPKIGSIRRSMCNFVSAHQSELRVQVLPYVHEVLEHLRVRKSVLGVATGNLRAIGRLKLRRAGLLDCFSFGGWSDAYECRSDVFSEAVRTAKALAGASASICVVGDTPADILAARQNQLPIIAVATGIYTADQLSAELPDACLQSLGDLIDAVTLAPA